MAGSNRAPRASDPGPTYALAAPSAAASMPMFFLAGPKQEGAKGIVNAILTALSARGILVSDAVRGRILRCQDLSTLDSWLHRALKASSADEVIEG